MAALSIGHSFHTRHGVVLHNKPTSRTKVSVSCESRKPVGESSDNKKKKEKEEEGKPWVVGLFGDVEKFGRGLKNCLSPKRKGDWKDLMLMSFSFAVYVYISQKLVCAYCAWMSMPRF